MCGTNPSSPTASATAAMTGAFAPRGVNRTKARAAASDRQSRKSMAKRAGTDRSVRHDGHDRADPEEYPLGAIAPIRLQPAPDDHGANQHERQNRDARIKLALGSRFHRPRAWEHVWRRRPRGTQVGAEE